MTKVNNMLFNSPFEMSIRVLLLLSEIDDYMSADKIMALDFIICYSNDYGLLFSNLHGINQYKLSEIANRRKLVYESIKILVTKGMIKVKIEKGYLFSITTTGKEFIDSLESSYSKEYRKISATVIDKYGSESEDSILNVIRFGQVSED